MQQIPIQNHFEIHVITQFRLLSGKTKSRQTINYLTKKIP